MTENENEAAEPDSTEEVSAGKTGTGNPDIRFRVATPEEAAEFEAADAQKRAAGDDILDFLGDNDTLLIEEREVWVNGEPRAFGIKRISIREANEINVERYRTAGPGRAPSMDTATENVRQWKGALVQCVYKNATPEAEEPTWVPFFTDEMLVGTRGRPALGNHPAIKPTKGLFDNPRPEAQKLVFDLLGEIWIVNSAINPMTQVQLMMAASSTSALPDISAPA